MRRRPYGPEAWIVDGLDDPAAWATALHSLELDAVREVVPAASTVLVRCVRERHAEIGARLDAVRPAPEGESDAGAELVIDVVYDGVDLAAVADACRLTIEELVSRHEQGRYHVAFCGFSPGFGYLPVADERLHLPRRATPRSTVAAGSVGLAAGFTCVYPSASPGGWHLLGRTDQSLWDVDRTPPAALWPGRPVRFRRVGP